MCSTPVPAGASPVLLVDDDAVSRSLIDASLDAARLANPRVHCPSGEAAVTAMSGADDGPPVVPALVMLDGNMPGMSGLDVLLWMRGQPALREVPVVMLTGVSDVESIRSAYDAGASSYLVKPIAFEAIADVLRGLNARWMLL